MAAAKPSGDRPRFHARTAYLALLLVACALLGPPAPSSLAAHANTGRESVKRGGSILGVYAGPDEKGVVGTRAFAAWAHARVTQTLDFAASDTWTNVSGPAWMLLPHSVAAQRLEYSLPLVLDRSGSLRECASGADNPYWHELARHLISAQLVDTIIRPGWEFNGGWFRWAAQSQVSAFVECFRNVVRTMRAAPGQHFKFDWNPSVGLNSFPAEMAYPGDSYVDYIGVDVYDYSWVNYPIPPNASASEVHTAQARTWASLLHGNHGLLFWSRFAKLHQRSLAIPEWGLSSREDGHGGGDDMPFMRGMIHFLANPSNTVAYHNYFNVADHQVTAKPSAFPTAGAQLRRWLATSY